MVFTLSQVFASLGSNTTHSVALRTDFQNRQTGYDAALKNYSIVQRMSLFDYVK